MGVTSDNKQVVKDFFDAFGKGDLDKAFSLASENFQWKVIGTTPVSGVYRGKSEVLSFIEKVVAQIDQEAGISIEIDDLIAEGDKVVALLRGRITGKFGPYNNTYCHVFTVRCGKLQSDVEYLDTALVDRALFGK